MFREALERGGDDVLLEYGNLLATEPGREAEAEALYRRALAAGETLAHNNLALLLMAVDRLEEAREQFLAAIRVGDPLAETNHEHLLERAREEAPELYRRWSTEGEPPSVKR